MRRLLLAPMTALAIASLGLSCVAATSATTAATAASPSPAPTKKDACASSKSKWAHTQCENFNNSAPGDEYFGKLKMSYLGIDNTFKDMSISAGAYTTDQRIISKLTFADDALRRWSSKYPGDPQLARSYFLGVQVLRKVYTQEMQKLAWDYIQILIKRYPTTYFGKTMKASLAQGWTMHWFALPQLCPTPLPKGVQPQNTPSATESPSPAPGQPAIDLITPPCVQPSIVPSPAASGSAMPGTAPTPTPSPTPKHH